MTSQQLQQALFTGGIIGIVLGVVMIGIALYIFFRYDIRGIHDDLTGKKRAEDIAKKMSEQARGKQAGRKAKAKQSQEQLAAGVHTGDIAQSSTGTGSGKTSPTKTQQTSSGAVDKAATKARTNEQRSSSGKPIPQGSSDEENTTVMGLDNEATTVLGEESDGQTTTLVDAEEAAADEQLSKSEEAQDDIQAETSVVIEEESDAETESVDEQAPQTKTPDYFQIVKKIVLTDSADYARMR